MAKIGCRANYSSNHNPEPFGRGKLPRWMALSATAWKRSSKCFYEHMGRSYLQPYEAGLRSLFDSVQRGDASVSSFLKKAKEAREIFDSKVSKIKTAGGQ